MMNQLLLRISLLLADNTEAHMCSIWKQGIKHFLKMQKLCKYHAEEQLMTQNIEEDNCYFNVNS